MSPPSADRPMPAASDGSPPARSLTPPPFRGIRAAFAFFTRIPVGGFPYREQDFAWAAAHAPLVGLVLGSLLGATDRLLLPLGALPAATMTVAISLLLTGAFHEDGLADTSDALGGGFDRPQVLAILKDSRIGAFGGVALVISIVGRAALIAELGSAAAPALALTGSAARTAPIWLMTALPYVTPDDLARSRAVARGGLSQAIVATLWLLAVTAALFAAGVTSGGKLAAVWLALALVAAITGSRYQRRVGGVTGDFLGATEQIGELAVLAVLVWRA